MFYLRTFALALVVLIAAFAGSVFLYQVLAFSTPQTYPPPQGNVALPLNVSNNPQTKLGPLGATAFYDANDSTYLLDPTGTSKLGGELWLGTGVGGDAHLIRNVQSPALSTDAATKQYVDDKAAACVPALTGNAVPSDVKNLKTFYSNSLTKLPGTAGCVQASAPAGTDIRQAYNSIAYTA